ncbi:hypothetical protein NOCARDAX2BIS_400070 [Nocardioides sp. AX2bis]|nr:hypothetical protein NOCARDAX2BIS_400070 [Nocardioides sp. AX2bis]
MCPRRSSPTTTWSRRASPPRSDLVTLIHQHGSTRHTGPGRPRGGGPVRRLPGRVTAGS